MVLPNERACSVLYATLEFLCSILSAIYAASSFCYRVRYYKTGVNGVVHFAELVNTYICVRKIIVLSSCFKKTAQCYDRSTKTECDFYYDLYCTCIVQCNVQKQLKVESSLVTSPF